MTSLAQSFYTSDVTRNKHAVEGTILMFSRKFGGGDVATPASPEGSPGPWQQPLPKGWGLVSAEMRRNVDHWDWRETCNGGNR